MTINKYFSLFANKYFFEELHQFKLIVKGSCGRWIVKPSDAYSWNRLSKRGRCTRNCLTAFLCSRLCRYLFYLKKNVKEYFSELMGIATNSHPVAGRYEFLLQYSKLALGANFRFSDRVTVCLAVAKIAIFAIY